MFAMDLKEGFCRIETKGKITFGKITEIHNDFILIRDFIPPMVETKINKKDIIHYDLVNEEDIPEYE